MAFGIATVVLGGLLLAAAWIDLRVRRIPDPLTAATVLTGMAASTVLGADLLAAAIGVVAGYGVFFLFNEAFRRVRGYDGIGMGDAKLLAGLGAWLGWAGLPLVVLGAASCALIFVLTKRRGRLDGAEMVPFGPFLAIAGFAVWLLREVRVAL